MKAPALSVRMPADDIIWTLRGGQGFRNKPISTAELNFKECFNGMNSFERRSDMRERTGNVSALHICTQEN